MRENLGWLISHSGLVEGEINRDIMSLVDPTVSLWLLGTFCFQSVFLPFRLIFFLLQVKVLNDKRITCKTVRRREKSTFYGVKETVPPTPATPRPWSRWGFACNPALFWSSPWTSVWEFQNSSIDQILQLNSIVGCSPLANAANWWCHWHNQMRSCWN